MSEYAMWITLTALPGQRDELVAGLEELAALLRDDPDCLLFAFTEVPDNPDEVRVLEAFTDAAVVAALWERPGVQALVERSTPFLAKREAAIGPLVLLKRPPAA